MRQSRKKFNLLSVLRQKNSNADTKKLNKKGYQMMAFIFSLIFSFIHTSGRVLITFFALKKCKKMIMPSSPRKGAISDCG
jgi:hypothetical protein